MQSLVWSTKCRCFHLEQGQVLGTCMGHTSVAEWTTNSKSSPECFHTPTRGVQCGHVNLFEYNELRGKEEEQLIQKAEE